MAKMPPATAKFAAAHRKANAAGKPTRKQGTVPPGLAKWQATHRKATAK